MTFHIENLISALSWTLVHSLWQGLLLAAAAAIVLGVAARSTAALRYNLLCALLCGFVFATVSTFVHEMRLASEVAAISAAPEPMADAADPVSAVVFPVDALHSAIGFIDRNALWIAVAWFALFCAKCVGIWREFGKLNRLRRCGTNTVPENWQKRFGSLKAQLGIRSAVDFLESQLIAVPCASGLLRPVILVPAGLLTSLPHDQVEAILLHELAHVKRRDFAMNLVQTFVEALFFFNPALLWLSAVMREERENCCDDLALSVSDDSPSLVRALLSVSHGTRDNALPVAFAGRGGAVLRRAKRILGVKTSVINQFEKSVIAFSVLLFALGVIACSADEAAAVTTAVSEKQLPDDMKAYERELHQMLLAEGVVTDTVNMSYRLSRTEFIVNGKRQPDAVLRKFSDRFMIYKNIRATFYNWELE